MSFLKKVEFFSAWKTIRPDRMGLPPRAFLNPKDFERGEKPGTAYVAPEFPKFAPPDWQSGIVQYLSEQECDRIFSTHHSAIVRDTWHRYCAEFGGPAGRARAERTRQRKIRRNKRAYHYWSGYVMGMKVAFLIAERIFKNPKP